MPFTVYTNGERAELKWFGTPKDRYGNYPSIMLPITPAELKRLQADIESTLGAMRACGVDA